MEGRDLVPLRHARIQSQWEVADLRLSGGRDGTARLWNVATARPHGPALWYVGQVTETTFTPDGAYLGTRDEGGIVRLWRTAARPLHGKPVFQTAAQGFAFGPGGK